MKTEKDANRSRHGCILFKKMRFLILRTLNDFFKIDFQRDLLRKVFYFKIKGNNLKITKHKKQNTKQNKKIQNHKLNFLTTEQTKVVRMEVNLHYFSMASEK